VESLLGRTSRRYFVVLAVVVGVLALVVAGAIDFIVNKHPLDAVLWRVAQQLLIGGAGALAGAALVLAIIQLAGRQEEELRLVASVDSSQTKSQHMKVIAETEFWNHDGHIGRWVRTTGLKALTAAAAQGGTKDVTLLIIDPLNTAMVESYAKYRRQVGYKERGYETREETILEVLATVVTFQLCVESNAGIRVQLFFRANLRNSRIDIASGCAFHTLIDPRVPSVIYWKPHAGNDTSFYYAMLQTFQHQLALARPHEFLGASGMRGGRGAGAQVRAYLDQVGLKFDRPDAFFAEVWRRSQSSYNSVL